MDNESSLDMNESSFNENNQFLLSEKRKKVVFYLFIGILFVLSVLITGFSNKELMGYDPSFVIIGFALFFICMILILVWNKTETLYLFLKHISTEQQHKQQQPIISNI